VNAIRAARMAFAAAGIATRTARMAFTSTVYAISLRDMA
jgi:hypothetical protein